MFYTATNSILVVVPEVEEFEPENVTPWNVTLRWQIKPNGLLSGLRIQLAGGDQQQVFDCHEETGRYTWQGLQPFTSYQFVLWAGTSQGQVSETRSVETDAAGIT